MLLVEEGYNFVASLEASNVLAHCNDGAGAVRAGNDVVCGREGVCALGDDEITVLFARGSASDSRLYRVSLP